MKDLKFIGYKQVKNETANPEAFWDYLFQKITKKMELTKSTDRAYIDDTPRYNSLVTIAQL